MAEGIYSKLLKVSIVDIALELAPNLRWKLKERGFVRGQCHLYPSANKPFYLHTDTNMFNCYSCGAGGNAVQLALDLIQDQNEFYDFMLRKIGIDPTKLKPAERRHYHAAIDGSFE